MHTSIYRVYMINLSSDRYYITVLQTYSCTPPASLPDSRHHPSPHWSGTSGGGVVENYTRVYYM